MKNVLLLIFVLPLLGCGSLLKGEVRVGGVPEAVKVEQVMVVLRMDGEQKAKEFLLEQGCVGSCTTLMLAQAKEANKKLECEGRDTCS